jgi:hypothetical protein
MTCESCTCLSTCREPCACLRAELPSTNNALTEKLCPTSALPCLPKLTLPEMERGATTELPKLPGFSKRNMAILTARYFEGMTHRQLSERFGFSERSSWVILHRLKARAVKVLTVIESC